MDKYNSIPYFFQKSWDFDTSRSVGIVYDCMEILTFSFEFLLKNYEYFQHFLYFFSKSTSMNTQYSWDDAVHKIPH